MLRLILLPITILHGVGSSLMQLVYNLIGGNRMVTRGQAVKAGEEVFDLVNLLVDQTPNSAQIGELVAEGFQAATAIGQTVIPPEAREAVLSNIAEGFLHKLNTTVDKFKLPEE